MNGKEVREHLLDCGVEFFNNDQEGNTIQDVLDSLKDKFGVNEKNRFKFSFKIDRNLGHIYYHSFVSPSTDLRI